MAIKETLVILSKDVWQRIIEIISSPFAHAEMFWILTPMIISMLLMIFYFGRYKKEELGWNTAFGNSMVLIFASVDMLRKQFLEGQLFEFNAHTILVIAIIIEGLFLTFFTFFHLLPKGWAFSLASGTTINIVVIFVLILIYGKIPIDGITAIASLILAITLMSIIRVIQILEPEAIDEAEDY